MILAADASTLIVRLQQDSGELRASVLAVDQRIIEVVPEPVYAELEPVAMRRIPRDPTDWPTVALAIRLGIGILTEDGDFLGCGCPTWTMDTRRAELEATSQ